MSRLVVGILLVGLSLAPLAGLADEVKRSGVIGSVRPDHRAITLEEMGPWRGPTQGVVRRSIALAPDARVTSITRSSQAPAEGWPGAFVESSLTPADLKPGDYVTVTTTTRDGQLVARSVVVVRPTPEQ